MTDLQLNAKSITTTSATTQPASGTVETWTVSALAAGIPTLNVDETFSLGRSRADRRTATSGRCTASGSGRRSRAGDINLYLGTAHGFLVHAELVNLA